jgi:hypothetical protein
MMRSQTTNSVIPAKAGIHPTSVCKTAVRWTPAFAGATMKGFEA